MTKSKFFSTFILSLFLLATSCKKDEECKDSDVSVTVFADVNYEGFSQTFPIGVHLAGSFNIVGNDKISSFKVSSPTCVKVTMCENQDLNNLRSCKEFTSDQVSLDDLNDKVSYIKVEKR